MNSHEQTERKLAAEEASRMVTVVRDSNDAITIQDFDGKITAWNHGAELMFGYSEQEALKMNIWQLAPQNKAAEQKDFNRRLFAGEKVTSFETQRLTKDGRLLDVWLTVTKLVDDAGEVIGIAATGRDITERHRAELELDRLFEVSPDMICIIGFDGCFKRLNPAWEKTLGHPLDDLLSRPFIEFVHPEDHEATNAEAAKLAQGARTLRFENRYRCKDSSYRWLSWAVIPAMDERLLYCVARDVTERKQAAEELRHHRDHLEQLVEARTGEVRTANAYNRSLIEASLDPFVTKGPDGRITDVNRATEAITGRSRQELIGTDFADYFTEPDRARAAYQKVFREGEVRDYELALCHKDGSIRPVLYNATVYRDPAGAVVGVFAAAHDITERKRAEEALRTLNRDLVRSSSELEAVNHELEAFSYSVSHDLKAPLRSVDGFAQMLEEDYAARLDDEGRRLLRVVRESARDMGRLINDLLTFSRLSRKDLKLMRIKLRDLAEDAKRQVEQGESGRRIRWEIGELPPAVGDEATIREVLVNLLANAVKFTRPRQEAVISIDGRVEGAEVVYSVKDNGVGFDMAYKDKLFCVFQRLHTSDEFEGTGIGLALVQRIVQRHGGRVWAEGKVDEGATFHFTLPRHTTEERRVQDD
jgi:PAS domain S-box-containing protein